jgi:hypothetical protein
MNGNQGIHDKVVAATLGAAVSQIVIFVLEKVNTIGDIPTAIEGAITTILVFTLGYFVKERKDATA